MTSSQCFFMPYPSIAVYWLCRLRNTQNFGQPKGPQGYR
ncbi:unnamed protein product [Brucella canis str. Oliveri]|nr:unnamed protein product [Brucella canis str. Oliveri]